MKDTSGFGLRKASSAADGEKDHRIAPRDSLLHNFVADFDVTLLGRRINEVLFETDIDAGRAYKPGRLRIIDIAGKEVDLEVSLAESTFIMAVIDRVVRGRQVPILEETSADPEALAEMAIAALPNKSPWDRELGPFFDTEALARWKDVTVEKLLELREENRVIALRTTDADGTVLYPRFQFDGRGRLLPHLPEIWPILTKAYSPWTAAAWLNTPDPDWGERTAAHVLRYGTEDHVALVLRDATQDAAGMTAR
ncbi:hypothetical protein ACRAWC_01660 [Leifsonia sp. L25]|uniref:hypothetical protein n=1 Tax=Actinomycetes TaxID=1760 RepID=UPI003D68CC57